MADIFREVDEEVRQDKIQLALTRNWGWILLAALLVVAGVGAWRLYDYWTVQKEEEAGDRFIAALQQDRDGKNADALATFQDLQRTGTPGYALLSRFRVAGQLGANDPAAGVNAFDAIAADTGVEAGLRDVARLRAAMLLLDTSDLQGLKNRLQPLADANSAMRNSARELLALAAIKAGGFDAAATWLDAIVVDPGASALARQRADALLGLVRSSKASVPAAPPAPAAAGTPAQTSNPPTVPAAATPSPATPAAQPAPTP